MNPLVSVVVPLYNREDLVLETVEAVLSQTLDKIELIVVDDRSTDGGLELVQGVDDPRVRTLQNAENRGVGYSRNQGIDAARAPYIAFCDSDDLWRPEKLERQVALLDRTGGHLCGTWARDFKVEDGVRRETGRWIAYPDPPRLKAYMLFNCPIPSCSVMVRKGFLDEKGLRFTNAKGSPAEDYDLWTRMMDHTDGYVVEEPLTLVREHPGRYSDSNQDYVRAGANQTRERLLAQLGIEPTPEEFALHNRFSRFAPLSPAELRAVDRWLRRLLAANEGRQVYRPEALREVVKRLWQEACARSPVAPGERVRVWASSPLALSSKNPRRLAASLSRVARGEGV